MELLIYTARRSFVGCRPAGVQRIAEGGASLPPISVYRVGDEHVVRDGHHRVSVARARVDLAIDAEVVELVR